MSYSWGTTARTSRHFINPSLGQPNERPHTRHTDAGNVNGGKFQLGDAGTHVPLIVWGPPSVSSGSVCDDLVDVVDLFPTFCQWGKVAVPADLKISGHSISPQINGRPGKPRKWVHHGINNEENVFDGTWRLFRNSQKMLNASELPQEIPVLPDNAAARTSRTKLNDVFQSLTPTTK